MKPNYIETSGQFYPASAPHDAAMLRLFFDEAKIDFKEVHHQTSSGAYEVHFFVAQRNDYKMKQTVLALQGRMTEDKAMEGQYDYYEGLYRKTYWPNAPKD